VHGEDDGALPSSGEGVREHGVTVPKPLVSVIIPAYNAERFIARTLDSASAQTCRALEIIVVDDGSTDRTAELVLAKAASDPRIRLLRQQNAGVAAARNTGVRNSRGRFIAPLDADDLWHRAKIERQLKRFEDRPEAGLVYCWSVGIDEDDLLLWRPPAPARFEGDVFAAMLFQDFIGNASVPLIRRECLEAVRGFDEGLRAAAAEGCEDRKLYLSLAERHDFALVPLFLVGYRQHPHSMSRDHDRMLRSYNLVMSEARRKRPDLPRRVLRWGRARDCLYLASRAASSGRHCEALSLGCTALYHDPMLLASRWFRAAVMRSLRKAAGGRPQEPSNRFDELPIDRAVHSLGWALERQRSYVQSLRMRPCIAAQAGADRSGGASAR
jgi:glycosyltransferase involved in cell wall biosynthesis